MVLAGLKSD